MSKFSNINSSAQQPQTAPSSSCIIPEIDTLRFSLRHKDAMRLRGRTFLNPRGTVMVFGDRIFIEASMPKVIGRSNSRAATVNEALKAAALLLRQVESILGGPASGTVLSARIERIDLVRDFFGVQHFPEIAAGIASQTLPEKRVSTFRAGRCPWSQTISTAIGYKSHVTLYDKSEESSSPVAGHIRSEAKLTRAWLGKQKVTPLMNPVSRLGDLEPAVLADLTEKLFVRCGYDLLVPAAPLSHLDRYDISRGWKYNKQVRELRKREYSTHESFGLNFADGSEIRHASSNQVISGLLGE